MSDIAPSEYLRVPARFWHDHWERAPYDDGVEPVQAVAVNARFATLRRDDPSLVHFYRDAVYYADPENMDDCPRCIRDSARRTLVAFDRAGLVYPRRSAAMGNDAPQQRSGYNGRARLEARSHAKERPMPTSSIRRA